MSDFQTIVINTATGLPPLFDLTISGGELLVEDGLQTAIILSLFSDSRALDDDVLPSFNSDKRGWWGDSYADISGDRFGSRLWLLSRERQLPEVIAKVKIYADEALQWLIDDVVVNSFSVDVSIPSTGILSWTVTINKPVAPSIQYQFTSFWNQQ